MSRSAFLLGLVFGVVAALAMASPAHAAVILQRGASESTAVAGTPSVITPSVAFEPLCLLDAETSLIRDWSNQYTTPIYDGAWPASVWGADELHRGAVQPEASGFGYVFAGEASVQHFFRSDPWGTSSNWWLFSTGSWATSFDLFDVAWYSGLSPVWNAAVRDVYPLGSPSISGSGTWIRGVLPGDGVPLAGSATVSVIGIAERRPAGLYDLDLIAYVGRSGSEYASCLYRLNLTGLSWSQVCAYNANLDLDKQYSYADTGGGFTPVDYAMYYGSSAGHVLTDPQTTDALRSELASVTVEEVLTRDRAAVAGGDPDPFTTEGDPADPVDDVGLPSSGIPDEFLPPWLKTFSAWFNAKLSGLVSPLIDKFLWWFPMFAEPIEGVS